jgi:chromosome segregation ATPase
MKSSLDGDLQDSPPVTRDEAQLANVREALIVEENKLKDFQEKTAIVVDLQGKIDQSNELLAKAAVELQKIQKEKAAIEKMTETTRAARAKAEHDAQEAKKTLLNTLVDVTAATDQLNVKKIELVQIDRDIQTAKDQYTTAKEVKEAKLDALDAEIAITQKKLSTVLGDIEAQEVKRENTASELIEAAALVERAVVELNSAKENIANLHESAANIISDAEAKASVIVSDALKAKEMETDELNRIKAEAEAVVIATAQSVANAKEVESLANARLASIEAIKEKVLIELGKSMKNAELEKGNKVIQDYLKEIQNV